ncbi:MAG: SDR family oxidoreductase [Clostridia bacterium]|nr:SDR family oxidoreductase [Clostridia bacterium]
MKQTALITGASGGIGRELAKIFAREGWNLVVVARSEDMLNELKRALEQAHGISVRVLIQDLADPGAPRRVAEQLAAEHMAVDALVNNAGFGDNGDFVDSDWQRQRDMVQLNVLALMELTHIFGAQMRDRGSGRILNIASVAAFFAGPRMSIYYASKAFVRSFSEAVSEEMRGTGVTVTALCLGPAKTGFEANAHMKGSRMFKLLFPENPRTVAEAGYRAMMAGRTLCYHGAVTKLANVAGRIAPRALARRVTKYVNGR